MKTAIIITVAIVATVAVAAVQIKAIADSVSEFDLHFLEGDEE